MRNLERKLRFKELEGLVRRFIPILVISLSALPLRAQLADDPAPTHKATAQLKLPPSKIAPNVPLTPRERAAQMLNRFAYGPRPGDVERVLQIGPDRWFEQQLNPDAIKDPALDARLRDFPSLTLTPEQILIAYPTDGYVRQVAEGKRPYPTDPLLASLYEVQVYKHQATVVDKTHPITELTPELADAQKDSKKESRSGSSRPRHRPAPRDSQKGPHGRADCLAG